jgi:PKD repeat protein
MRLLKSLFLLLTILTFIAPVSAFPPPPVANFTADYSVGYSPEPVRFIDTSTGDPVSWYWDFGDGKSSTLRNPEHTYPSHGGVYRVSLKVANAAGSNISASKEIYMADSGTEVPTTIAAQPAAVRTGNALPSSTPTGTPLPFSLVILAIMIGAVFACIRR